LISGTQAKDPPSGLRVVRVEHKAGARLDGDILRACDVTTMITGAIERRGARAAHVPTTDLVLRIDIVAKLRGHVSPMKAGGTELGITLLRAGTRELNQPFLCRKDATIAMTNAAHCSRVRRCSDTIAEQMSMWLAASAN
jgi:hypothetical protein